MFSYVYTIFIDELFIITPVNKDFAHEEKYLFLMYFLEAEFKYVSRISLSPTYFVLHHTMWPHAPTYVSHCGSEGSSLYMM